MITVESMGKNFDIVIKSDEDEIRFTFKQLNYFQRNKVATKSTAYESGKLYLDVGLQVFYNLKYGLKNVEGLSGENGEPYKLRFDGEELTDDCVDELLACPISDKIIYAARDLSGAIPKEITDPVTNKPIEGIEVIKSDKKEALEKK